SGFLGRALAQELAAEGSEVVILTRTPRNAPTPLLREIAWDGASRGDWIRELDGAHAVVNLTGRNVDCRYTPANKREIIDSRVASVSVLGQAVGRVQRAPRVWVQASSLAIYGDAGDRVCEEDAPHGSDFGAEVCELWERAFDEQQLPGVRKVVLRIGFVIGSSGGALKRLTSLVQAGLGGTVGSGKQYISWLHIADMNGLFRAALSRSDFNGTYNATGPAPVTNREFMRVLRAVLGRGWAPPTPAFAARLGAFFLRTEASLALSGRRCVPRRLREQGFGFQWPQLETALRDVLRVGE
ncbi:MAG TPA: TIGR01777 family oxidoreductase, partial [Polyangiales bacterium]|nr:TIGR01777 family oxidoreductase [Polyangiales bacterium]